jgi:hypothetical protein
MERSGLRKTAKILLIVYHYGVAVQSFLKNFGDVLEVCTGHPKETKKQTQESSPISI